MGEYQAKIQSLLSQVVGIAGHFGHWASGMPIARGKGVNFNSLLHRRLT